MQRKEVEVLYFKQDGEIYRVEQEFVVGLRASEDIVKYIIDNKVRYKGLDFVILDGEDGVRPYIQPKMVRAERNVEGSKGFGR